MASIRLLAAAGATAASAGAITSYYLLAPDTIVSRNFDFSRSSYDTLDADESIKNSRYTQKRHDQPRDPYHLARTRSRP